MTKAPPDRDIGKPVHRKPGTHDGYKCELCGAWIELRNLREVLAHEGPLPHAVKDSTGRPRHEP
jgi:hypothetical protein